MKRRKATQKQKETFIREMKRLAKISRKSAITAEKFEQSTGRKPVHDDLERVNCKRAGTIGHFMCGWNENANLPVFEAGVPLSAKPLGPSLSH